MEVTVGRHTFETRGTHLAFRTKAVNTNTWKLNNTPTVITSGEL